MLRHRVLVLIATVAGSVGLVASASAADITGTWDLPSGDVFAQEWTFTTGTGTLAGEGMGGVYTWPMEGTLSGDSVQIRTAYRNSSYVAYFVGTVAPDGKSMSGTWATGGYTQAASSTLTWLANRRGGGGGGTTPPKTPTDPAKQPTGAFVMCNRGPNPGDDSICTATVGGTGANPTQPTGSVNFTAGDGGTFRYGPTCPLQPAPGSPTVASCSVTYIPPPSRGFPDVVATYPGDATHSGSSARTRLLSGPVFGLTEGTPITPETCRATVDKAIAAAGKAKASYQQRTPAPTPGPGPTPSPLAGADDYVAHCARQVGEEAFAGAERAGYVEARAQAGTGAACSYEGGRLRVRVDLGACVGLGTIVLGERIRVTNDRVLQDPPDPKYKVAVKPKLYRLPAVKPGKGLSAKSARRVNSLLARQGRAAALAAAVAAAIDKAGGARNAKDNKWVGIQTSAAIKYARQLATTLDALGPQTKTVLKLVAKHPSLKRRVTARQAESVRARLTRGMPTSLRRTLRTLGWSKREISALRTTLVRKPDAATAASLPGTVGALLADSRVLSLYSTTALSMRYFSINPDVVAASKLK